MFAGAKDAGRTVADSGFIIEYLKQTYGDSLDAGLDAQAQARSHVLRRLAEEQQSVAEDLDQLIDLAAELTR